MNIDKNLYHSAEPMYDQQQNVDQAHQNRQGTNQMYIEIRDESNDFAAGAKQPKGSYNSVARDKKAEIQIITSADARQQEYNKPHASQSTRNAFNADARKISLKHPETTKNVSNHPGVFQASSDFQNDPNSY